MGIKEYQFLSSTLQEVAKLNEERLGKIDSLKAAEEKLKGKNGDVKDIEDSIPESEEKIAEYEAALPVAKQHKEAQGKAVELWGGRVKRVFLVWALLILLTMIPVELEGCHDAVPLTYLGEGAEVPPNILSCFGAHELNDIASFLVVFWVVIIVVQLFRVGDLEDIDYKARFSTPEDHGYSKYSWIRSEIRELNEQINQHTEQILANKSRLQEDISKVSKYKEIIVQLNNEITFLSDSIALKMEKIEHLVPPDTN